jgi:hypothetical protein
MEHFIGCDAHKKFSVFVSINEKGEYGRPIRVGHDLEMFREFLKGTAGWIENRFGNQRLLLLDGG